MHFLLDFIDPVRVFLERGGEIVVVITWVILIMWWLIIERTIYLCTAHRRRVRQALATWEGRTDPHSWYSGQIYAEAVSEVAMRLRAGIPMIGTLAAVCPLLGLLGTVTGMILVFDVMAFMGSVSPRAVAAGVSEATISTMAGMVGALSGVFAAAMLMRMARQEVERLQQRQIAASDIRLSRISLTPRAVRLTGSFFAALTVTLGLLFLMQGLIVTGKSAIGENTDFMLMDFIRVRQAEEIQQKDIKPKEPEAPEQPPEKLLEPATEETTSGGLVVSKALGPLDTAFSLNVAGTSGFAIRDADYLPIVKVLPIYPRRAQSRGLSGWVMVRFTITVTGAVTNVEVTESSDPVFDRAAMQAAAKFKYKPRVIDGVPVEVHGVLHKITFEIETSGQSGS